MLKRREDRGLLCVSLICRERVEDASAPRLLWKSAANAFAKIGNVNLSTANAKATQELGSRDGAVAATAAATPAAATTIATTTTSLSLSIPLLFSLHIFLCLSLPPYLYLSIYLSLFLCITISLCSIYPPLL